MKMSYCDRCGKQINHTDDRVADQLAQDYPGKDICVECDAAIQLAAQVAQIAVISNRSPKDVIQSWLKAYGD